MHQIHQPNKSQNSLPVSNANNLTVFRWKVEVTSSKSISGRVDRASATEAVDSGSIPGRVKPKTIKIGIHIVVKSPV